MSQAKPLFTAQQVRTGERIAAQLAGIEMYQLMLSAGEAVFEQVIARYGQQVKLLVLCGGGNNGGDGYVVAKLALQQQMTVNVVALKDPSKLTGDALKAYEAFIDAGGQILSHISNAADVDVIVDAMLAQVCEETCQEKPLISLNMSMLERQRWSLSMCPQAL
ncbi:NAD(P)HX epimerase [Vibrio ponticus]|nr:NAD(P)HX epimerase [Vibrio ponticus]